MNEPIKLTYNTINEKVDDLVYRAVTEVGIEIDKEKLYEVLTLYSKVVRCRDCKYFELGSECTRQFEIYEVTENDFCSWAEPKGKNN